MVDSTAGCERICMLDAYQGYHQVPLAVEDQEKVSFITVDGTFCYTVMPFGLRNAGAMYQRMMDKIFREKIGCNVEVYVDDILIKSPLVVNLIKDVEETCQTLWQYGLKLNPLKCLFGAKGGKFLGYLVTERGIEANPEKVRALRDMQVPQNLKETEATIDWQTPMISYVRQGTLSADPEESWLVRKQAHAYVMIGDQLYKRSFSRPLLKCLGMEEADQALREIQLGCCGNHVGGRALSRKVLLAGYFWPTLQRDAHKLVNTCLSFQKYQNLTHRPTALLRTSIVSCPFGQWSMDIVGQFPMAPGQKRFLLVAVDYFSKWVEAEALARITEDAVIQFLWKNILCRFDIPHKLVSDNGRQFQGQKIQAWCKGFGITQAFTLVASPQSNGQTEVVIEK
ncbi:uncharacterized protein K02A2.6-like [Zingiber officinale]|uniref:uncharacterized protein K02A2.6-like n=1 Tax=Zingiber officinale TaxID=94328 RepID=UPI001C4C3B66|nr:uncharacterized protein K02A2.6-like [Zingiber officinale]